MPQTGLPTLAELVATIPEEMGVAVPGSSSEDEAAETTSTSSTGDCTLMTMLETVLRPSASLIASRASVLAQACYFSPLSLTATASLVRSKDDRYSALRKRTPSSPPVVI